jgi:hypothetical protein
MNGEARLEQQGEPQFVGRAPLDFAGICEGEPALSFFGHGETRRMPLKGEFSILEP